MNTGDKLATVDEVKAVYDIFATEPPLISIPTTMWTGTGPYTSTWTVTGVTANSKLDYTIDETISNLKADLKLTPSTDTVTISTTKIPAGTINVTVIPKATKVGTVEYDLPDNVYSKSQVDALIQQSTAWYSSSASFTAAANAAGITERNYIGEALDAIKSGISSQTNDTIVNKLQYTSGPAVYAIVGKTNDNYFAGMAWSYYDQRFFVEFIYSNGSYKLKFM